MCFFGGLVYHLYYACGAILYRHRSSLHPKQVRTAIAKVRCHEAIFQATKQVSYMMTSRVTWMQAHPGSMGKAVSHSSSAAMGLVYQCWTSLVGA
jgi:hypothetical protein